MTVQLRAPREDELAEIAELANRVSGELFGEREETEATVGLWLTAPELDRAHDIRVAVSDGVLVGYADIAPHPEPKYWLDVRIPPSADAETRDALIAWGEARARKRGAELIRAFAYEQDERGKQALERHGYELIRHSYRMRIRPRRRSAGAGMAGGSHGPTRGRDGVRGGVRDTHGDLRGLLGARA